MARYEASRDIAIRQEGRFLLLTSPWLSLEIETNAHDAETVAAAVQAIREGRRSDASDWLLAKLLAYPISAMLPRNICFGELLGWGLREPTLHRTAIEPFLTAGTARLPRTTILAKSRKRLTPVYDALSLFTQIRLQLCAHPLPKPDQDFAALQAADPQAFLEFAKFYIRQNHFVTQHAADSLAPSLASPYLKNLMHGFIASERGHDKLMEQSLTALGVTDPEAIEVLPEVRQLVSLLAFTAGRYRLAFAVLVDLFERESPESEHPLAVLLAQTEGGKKAAIGLARHTEINQQQQHTDFAIRLAAALPSLKDSAAQATIQLAEAALNLREGIRQKIQERLAYDRLCAVK